MDVPAILIMRLFECHDVHGTLELDAFADAIKLIESYVFRRAICGEQTRGYWKVFANLAYQIDPDCPLKSLEVGLARQRDAYRFPDDAEFHQALTDRDVYGKRVCFELLNRLENDGSKEPTDTSKLLDRAHHAAEREICRRSGSRCSVRTGPTSSDSGSIASVTSH